MSITLAPHRLTARALEARTVDVDPARRTVTARFNTGIVDRYRTVIDPGSLRTDAYMKNPVVLWEHGDDPARGSIAIGRCTEMKRSKRETIGRVQFHDDEFSEALWRLYEAEIMRGWSIYALPDSEATGRPTAAELAENPGWAKARAIYRNSDLCEFSAVGVPGNPEALTVAIDRGLVLPEGLKRSLERAMKDADDDDKHPDHTVVKDGERHFVKLARCNRCIPARGCSDRAEATALCRTLNAHHKHMAEEYGGGDEDNDEGATGRSVPPPGALPSLAACRSMSSIEARVTAALTPLAGSIRRQIVADAAELARGGI